MLMVLSSISSVTLISLYAFENWISFILVFRYHQKLCTIRKLLDILLLEYSGVQITTVPVDLTEVVH